MSTETIVHVGAILFLGSVLQSAVGFAYSLFAVPMLVWIGLPLSHAVAVVSVSIFFQVLMGAYRLRKDIKWNQVIPSALIRNATIPLGIGLLIVLDSIDKSHIKQILGLLLFAVLTIQLFLRVQPRDTLHRGWMFLAFSCSGILFGLAAMGGSPVVIWVAAQRWSGREIRAFLFTLFMSSIPIQTILLFASFGRPIAWSMLLAVALSPLVVFGSAIGVRLGDSLNAASFRGIAYVILFMIAVSSMFAPVF